LARCSRVPGIPSRPSSTRHWKPAKPVPGDVRLGMGVTGPKGPSGAAATHFTLSRTNTQIKRAH
jgi:hypothetical protein